MTQDHDVTELPTEHTTHAGTLLWLPFRPHRTVPFLYVDRFPPIPVRMYVDVQVCTHPIRISYTVYIYISYKILSYKIRLRHTRAHT